MYGNTLMISHQVAESLTQGTCFSYMREVIREFDCLNQREAVIISQASSQWTADLPSREHVA